MYEPSPELLKEEAEFTQKIRLFAKQIIRERDKGKKSLRAFHPKHTGFVKAEFVVDMLPEHLRVGMFAKPGRYPAWVRFSNATARVEDDNKAAMRGLAIRVENVPGKKIAQTGPGDAGHDFFLNSYPVMPMNTVREFFEVGEAAARGPGKILKYVFNPFAPKPGIFFTAMKMNTPPKNPVDHRYYSQVPYRFGDRVVKYGTRPLHDPWKGQMSKSENCIREALEEFLKGNEASFEFMVQFYKDDRSTPIEKPSVEWKTPFERVATLHIPKQDKPSETHAAMEMSTGFHPWLCLPEHEPIGGINRARREVYGELWEFRTKRNQKGET